ncbi:diaminobutyrate--2-oxoglutarate transaminase [Reinekea sp.]|uniref:diaminobutyrate--2-oxoglutarate transaminase n=1 Tax=Reinekea sp. TaxID=1970455 RepID=UPI00257BE50D|nr:diaminobutyrate--2-oxoglutarate transaminase [Reinekea sp.]
MFDLLKTDESLTAIFETHESQVRSYCRNFNKLFTRANGCRLYDATGDVYLDFLSCAGALNYGHNPAGIKAAIIDYIAQDGIQGALDLHTEAKKEFIETFNRVILQPRKLRYKIQFTSPTGTSVVESAVKLARKVTQRKRIVAFTNAYHGMTGTALGLTGNADNRQAVMDTLVDRIPFDHYVSGLDSVDFLSLLWSDRSSGYELPAAVILETVQGEGGINVASAEWVRKLRRLTLEKGVLLIIDDIQAGCGRTGHFFSFERFDIQPDLVCLSKSLSGYGYPLSVLLMNPELDIWSPGEDNGTFRGNSLAMVAGRRALELYWQDDILSQQIGALNQQLQVGLRHLQHEFPDAINDVRGRGLMLGIAFYDAAQAAAITRECFNRHLILERCGNEDQVIKFFPPLTISAADLQKGLDIFADVVGQCLATCPIEISA